MHQKKKEVGSKVGTVEERSKETQKENSRGIRENDCKKFVPRLITWISHTIFLYGTIRLLAIN